MPESSILSYPFETATGLKGDILIRIGLDGEYHTLRQGFAYSIYEKTNPYTFSISFGTNRSLPNLIIKSLIFVNSKGEVEYKITDKVFDFEPNRTGINSEKYIAWTKSNEMAMPYDDKKVYVTYQIDGVLQELLAEVKTKPKKTRTIRLLSLMQG